MARRVHAAKSSQKAFSLTAPGERTLFGRYDAIEAVKTMEPLMPSLMKIRAAARAQKKAPNSCVASVSLFTNSWEDIQLTLMLKSSCISSSVKSNADL